MVRKIFPSVMAALCVGLFVAGCDNDAASPGDTPPAGVTNEVEAMKAMALSDAFVQNEEQTFTDQSIAPTNDGTFGTIASDIIPVSWGRFIDAATTTTTVTIQEGDSVATAQVVRNISGTFKIMAKQNPTDTTLVIIEKPFSDQSVRNVIFKRVARRQNRFWLNWTPVATSLVDGKTTIPPADQDINITQIQFIRPIGDTITITDPTSFYLRYQWRNLIGPGTSSDVPEMRDGQTFSVLATVVSASPDTDIVTLRYGFSPTAHRRMAMSLVSQTTNEDGTFTRVYQVTAEIRHHPGFFHAGVLALSHKTLFDDAPTSYSVNWWGMPYRVL